MSIREQAIQAADNIIASLPPLWANARNEIADLFENDLWNGNWDSYLEVDGLPTVRFIQEDEFDQSMDDDDKPSEDNYHDFVEGHYIYILE